MKEKYFLLKPIKFLYRDKRSDTYWEFMCDCGNKIVTKLSRVKSGGAKSCGCLQLKWARSKELKKFSVKHGMSTTRFWRIWSDMHRRLNNKSRGDYYRYGGRGIKSSKEWLKFENFKNDMYKQYQSHVEKFGEKNTSLDRINVDGNYCKENCRWATVKEQANNTRKNVFYIKDGIKLSQIEWERKLGMTIGSIYRKRKQGLTINEILK